MPFLIEDILAAVIWLIVAGLTATAGFIVVTVHRRISRQRYFDRLDLARHRAREAADPLFTGALSLEDAVLTFQTFKSEIDMRALEEMLLGYARHDRHAKTSREAIARLGWIRQWSDIVRAAAPAATGQVARALRQLGDDYTPPKGHRKLEVRLRANFLARGLAADKLSRVPTRQGLCALIAGTQDPNLDVEEVCIRGIGRLNQPLTMPVLIEGLINVLEGRSRQSIRHLKTALVQFSLDDVDALLPAMRHTNRRIRFFAVDIVREIADRHANTELVTKERFSPDMYRVFTEQLHTDEWGDVRARAATVIARFHDATSYDLLRKLLEDQAWFVRLHAVRATSGELFSPMAAAVAKRISDSHWLVRESAVRSLAQMGDLGIQQIYKTFVETTDRYAAEQIAEQIQRSGMLDQMLAVLVDGSGVRPITGGTRTEAQRLLAIGVIRRLAQLGKITMLLGYLLSPTDPELKVVLISEVGICPTNDCIQTLRLCAEADGDPEVRAVAVSTLERMAAVAAASASAGGAS